MIKLKHNKCIYTYYFYWHGILATVTRLREEPQEVAEAAASQATAEASTLSSDSLVDSVLGGLEAYPPCTHCLTLKGLTTI